tara:strand:+ start:43 stop:489 length:447 start_codon:yes stop_codon:yes gene_type:complete
MFSKKQKFKNIFFVLLANVLVFSGFEWVAGYLIQEDNIYGNVGMMDGNHPLMEFDGDLGYQIRKQAMVRQASTFPFESWQWEGLHPLLTKRELFAVRMEISLLTAWDIVALILKRTNHPILLIVEEHKVIDASGNAIPTRLRCVYCLL